MKLLPMLFGPKPTTRVRQPAPVTRAEIVTLFASELDARFRRPQTS